MDIASAMREIWRWDRTHFQGLDLEDHRHSHCGPWRWISECPQSRLWPCWFPGISKMGTFQQAAFKSNTPNWMHILHSTASVLWANSLQNAVLNSSIRPILEEISSVEMTTSAPCSIVRAVNHRNMYRFHWYHSPSPNMQYITIWQLYGRSFQCIFPLFWLVGIRNTDSSSKISECL